MISKRPYKKRKKRVGCGTGSGHGKTSTRGHKGQLARSGGSTRLGFEGGQNPLYRRLPKRGFNRAALQSHYRVINVDLLATLDVNDITPDTLISKGIIKSIRDGLKVLGKGEITKPLQVQAHWFSKSAKEKIEKAGGRAIVIEKKLTKPTVKC